MDEILTFFLSQSILIPILIILFRIKRMPINWTPLIILIFVAFLSEMVSFGLIYLLRVSNASVIRIYSLLEALLILYQFYLWKPKSSSKLFIILGVACASLWLFETIFAGTLNTFSPYFRVFYAFVIVLLSINQINIIIVKHDEWLLKNPYFIICLAFIIFFIYQIIYEAAFFIGANKFSLANKIILGFGYINFGVNILYGIVFLLINKKKLWGQKINL